MYNVERMFVAHDGSDELLSVLSNLDDANDDQTYVNPVRDSSQVSILQTFVQVFFSSPEHKVLRVSYCDRPLSVIVRRPSSVNFFT